MNIAILGYGSIAMSHVKAIAALRETPTGRDLRVTTVMGRRADETAAFAREIGATTATDDLDRVLADDALDAVIVCSPSTVHAEQTERALRADKHVLCEIPLALSLADTDRLIATAAAADRRLMVCHTQRYYAPLVEARRMVAAGELHPHAIVSRYMFGRRENINWQGRRRSWTDNLLWHHGCHAVDAALWLLGAEEVETTAQVALPGEALGIAMDLTLAMRTTRDQLATVAMSYTTHIPIHDYLVIGEETTILFADNELRGPDGVLVPAAPRGGTADPIARQDAEFFAAIREQREPAVSGRAVRPAMAALQAAQDTLDARLRESGGAARHPRLP